MDLNSMSEAEFEKYLDENYRPDEELEQQQFEDPDVDVEVV